MYKEERNWIVLIILIFVGNSFGDSTPSEQYQKANVGSAFSSLMVQNVDVKNEEDSTSSKTSSFPTGFVITPAYVSQDGKFLSHHVTRFTRPPDVRKARRRRAVKDLRKSERVYFAIDLENRTFILNVSQNTELFHPNFIVEKFQKNADKERSKLNASSMHQSSTLRRETKWKCHFRGHVVDYPNSSVVVSACNGMTGLIRFDDVDYFIEPLMPPNSKTTNLPQPHKIYKRDTTVGNLKENGITSTSHGHRPQGGPVRGAKTHASETEDLFDMNRNEKHFRRFCGVADTKRRYRRELRRRKWWESRRTRNLQSHASRKRRSLSQEHWIEMMVAVDHNMVEYYGDENVERYVLTIINMVSELFRDVSIGNSLQISLIRLIILEEEEKELSITSHAEKTLGSFCRWAKRMNPQSDQHANHHDVAVLLTRQDLCANPNKSCETLGLAHVAGMCQPHRSCNVNQDTGLSLAFTVAHELGHNFAMHHDGQLNNCEPNDNYPRVMAPHLSSNNLPMRWSSCSRRYITRFFERNWGFCLLDPPAPDHDHYSLPNDLPGVLYNADHQCRLAFGSQSRQCDKEEEDICTRLWCLYKGTCRTRLHSAVPGTECAPGKWCYEGSCVTVHKKPSAVDGSWGPWTQWTRCSRTCGVGVTQTARYCNQPSPKNGGKYCLGERRRYRTCNVWNCQKLSQSASFRAQQCAEFSKIPYKDHLYTWLPVDSPIYPCELHCYTRDAEKPFADRLRDKVVDGTRCYAHGKDICVDGICKKLGCDFQIGSLAQEDKCGVCRGNGSSCSEVRSYFDQRIGDEYVVVGTIPKGARRVEIAEVATSGNFLALRSAANETEFYLNGNYKIQWDFQLDLAGTVFNYRRINKSMDNITAEGPVHEDVVVMLLFVEENPGINISYIMPHNVTAMFENQHPDFKWKMQPWNTCSRTCGEGIQMSLAVCTERRAGIVDEDFCNQTTKPKDERRNCSNPKCSPEWYIGPWNPCSVSCGVDPGRQERTVQCVRSINDDEQVVLNKTDCNEVLEPENMRSCSANNQEPCPMWRVFEWKNCSSPCGNGYRNRSVKCVTYVTTDVITVNDDEANFDDYYSNIESGGESSPLENEIRSNEISKIMIVERPLKKNIWKKNDYEIEEEDKCDPETRPDDVESCNNYPCQSKSFVSGSGSIQSTIAPQNPIFTSRKSNETKPTSRDWDFDIEIDDLFSTSKQENGSLSGSEHRDILDITSNSGMNPKSVKTELSQNDSETQTSGSFTTTSSFTNEAEQFTASVSTTTVPPPTISPRWLAGIWGQCSTTCGVGAQIRNVVCSAGPGHCDQLTRPAPAKRCHGKPCAEWEYAGWTKCSRLCGEGRKKQRVQCRGTHFNQILPLSSCEGIPKLPRVTSSCIVRKCLAWRTSRWSRCSVPCGVGLQRRRVGCLKKGMCDISERPVSQKNCRMRSCAEWRAMHWGRCLVKCGNGLKRRSVKCVDSKSRVLRKACNPKQAPAEVKKCNNGPCRETDVDYSSCSEHRPALQLCFILKRWEKCEQPSLVIQCCKTCRAYVNIWRKNKLS